MKKICLFTLVFALALLSVLTPIAADSAETDTTVVTEEATDGVTPENDSVDNVSRAVQLFVLGGSVVGALLVVTLLYKKKDEIRYL